MKPTRTPNHYYPKLFAALCLFLEGFSLVSCSDECETTTITRIQDPVFMIRSEVAKAIKSEPGKELGTTGKIYAQDRYVFINELFKGIHVIDNSNPAAPKNIAFINIPGNVDMAIRNNILLADAGPDLLAIDITDPTNAVLRNHTFNIFPGFSTGNNANTSEAIVQVGTTTRLVTQVTACSDNRNPGIFFTDNRNFASTAQSAAASPTTGTGGSMARFTIYNNYLYAINQANLQVFNIASPANPQRGASINIGWGIETIFPYKDKLFFGSQTGMHIYENSNPAAPTRISTYQHVLACDPVVVNDKYAYVTLRNGTTCRNNVPNQLEVIDISNLALPKSVKIYPMKNPHGLGIDGNTLFVCEGDYGLKTFDAANPLKISDNQLAHFKNLHAFDVIPLGYTLLTIGKDGLYQYDYSNPKEIKLLSKIPVNHNN